MKKTVKFFSFFVLLMLILLVVSACGNETYSLNVKNDSSSDIYVWVTIGSKEFKSIQIKSSAERAFDVKAAPGTDPKAKVQFGKNSGSPDKNSGNIDLVAGQTKTFTIKNGDL